MMKGRTRSRGLPLYLIPIVLGMSGVLFARQFENQVVSVAVLLTSVAVALFAGGNILARLRSQGYERYLLAGGLLLLAVGAMITTFEMSGRLPEAFASVPKSVGNLSHWLGLSSLLVGVCAVLFIVVRREEATEEIGERFRHLAEHMSEGFIFVSPDGTVVLVNKALSDLTGVPEEELIGKNARQMASEFNLEPMLVQMDNRARGLASEYRLQWNKDGRKREFFVSGTPVFDGFGRLAGHLATFRDMTEQFELARRLEGYSQNLEKIVAERTEQLDESQERLRNLLIHMNEGFLTLDATFRVHFANERFCQLIQVKMSDAMERDVFDFIEPVSRGRLLELFELAKSSQGQRNQNEISLLRPSGAMVPVVVAIAAIADAAENEPCYSLVVTDVSDLKTMQHQLESRAKELEAVNEELRSLDRAKDSFLTNVSHELRTPLSTVRGYVEMLQSNSLGTIQDAQAGALRVMMRNIERLQMLIEEMIDFSRMVIRGVDLTRTLFSVTNLVQECVASASPQMTVRQIAGVADVTPDFPPVWGDRKRLTQVMTILMSNAVKFSNQGGSIHIRAQVRANHTLALSVADTGIGIENAYQKRIFDKFFQVDHSLARRYEGAGIGLSIAKSIIEAHGGNIELDSQPNRGSTFTLVLPGIVFSLEEPAPPALKGLHVLVLSAEQEFAHAIADVLISIGCNAVTSSSGNEGLRLAFEAPLDFILIDEILDDMTGESLLPRLAQHPASTGLPLLLLEGGAAKAGRHADRTSDATRLAKPFSADELARRIEQQCQAGYEEPRSAVQSHGQSERDVSPFLLAVDQDPDLLEWLETALSRRGIPCICASGLQQAIEIARKRSPEMVLLNADLTDGKRPPLLDECRKADSLRRSAVYLMTGVNAELPPGSGVAGVFHKPFAIDDVAEAFRKVHPQLK